MFFNSKPYFLTPKPMCPIEFYDQISRVCTEQAFTITVPPEVQYEVMMLYTVLGDDWLVTVIDFFNNFYIF